MLLSFSGVVFFAIDATSLFTSLFYGMVCACSSHLLISVDREKPVRTVGLQLENDNFYLILLTLEAKNVSLSMYERGS